MVRETVEGPALILLSVLLQEEHALEEVVQIGLVIFKAQFFIGTMKVCEMVFQPLPSTLLGPHHYNDIGIDHLLARVQYSHHSLGTGAGLAQVLVS